MLKIQTYYFGIITVSLDVRIVNYFVFTAIGPLHLGSRDQIFAQTFYIMSYNLKNTRKRKEHIENIKVAKFEAPCIKE